MTTPKGRCVPISDAWRDEAVCASEMVPMLTGDWLIFVGKASKVERVRLIKQYCRQCPVIAQCGRWADRERGFVGVAGGAIYSPTSDGKAHKRIEVED